MKLFIALLSSVFLLFSCVKNNPDPSWIEVNKWTLEANSSASFPQGELSHNFTDAYVIVDNKIMGIFEVPFKIPILKSGAVNIKIYPVVKNNGISATKKIYPFVEAYDLNVNLEQNKTLVINPVTRYNSITQFWIEDFEDATIKIDNKNSDVQIHTGSDSKYLKYGNAYGRISLNTKDSLWEGVTHGNLILPKNGKEVYLEIDYFNTNSITTGLLAVTPSGSIDNVNIKLNKQDEASVEWKKIYIDLKELVSYSTTATSFEITFKALIEAGLSSSDVILDNIKVVHN